MPDFRIGDKICLYKTDENAGNSDVVVGVLGPYTTPFEDVYRYLTNMTTISLITLHLSILSLEKQRKIMIKEFKKGDKVRWIMPSVPEEHADMRYVIENEHDGMVLVSSSPLPISSIIGSAQCFSLVSRRSKKP